MDFVLVANFMLIADPRLDMHRDRNAPESRTGTCRNRVKQVGNSRSAVSPARRWYPVCDIRPSTLVADHTGQLCRLLQIVERVHWRGVDLGPADGLIPICDLPL